MIIRKLCKKAVSLIAAMALTMQTAVFIMPAFSASAEGETYKFTPYLAEGASIKEETTFFVNGIISEDTIKLTESKNISFKVFFEDGWSYNATYSNIFSADKSNVSISNTSSYLQVTYKAIAGNTVPLSTFDDVAVYTTAEELPSLWINLAGDDEGTALEDITKERWFTANFNLILGTKKFKSGNYEGTGYVKARGNTSSKAKHLPLSIKLDKKASWLDIPKTKKYAIITTYYDDSYVKNYVAYKSSIGLDGIGYTVKCEMVKVYVNDEYRDVYTLCERIAIESNKIDIDDSDLLGANIVDPATGDAKVNVTGGAILEANTAGKQGGDIAVASPYNTALDANIITFKDPDEDIPQECLDYIENLFKRLHNAVLGISGEDYKKYIDLDSWADFAVFEEVVKNCDGNMKTSCFLLKQPNSEILEMTAPWDFDLAFGGSGEDNNTGKTEKNDLTAGTTTDGFMIINSSNPWYKALFEKSEFRELVREKYTKYRYTIFENMLRLIDEQSAYMDSTIANGEREVRDAVKTLKNWLNKRLEWLDEQWLIEEDTVKIACVGDSNSTSEDSYAEKLQTALGSGYEVTGYGVSNAGVKSYRTYTEYLKALSCDADYVIIMLGSVDGNNDNYNDLNNYFNSMLTKLITAFSAKGTEVYVATSPTLYTGSETRGYSDLSNVNTDIVNRQKTVAKKMGCKIIDINAATANKSDLFAGGLTANDIGDTVIAEAMLENIFSEVISTIEITSKPDATVSLGSLTATADSAGKASFKLMPGEYTYSVAAAGYIPKQGSVRIKSGKNSLAVSLEIDEDGLYEISNLALGGVPFDNYSQGVGNNTGYYRATDQNTGVVTVYELDNINDGDLQTFWQYDDTLNEDEIMTAEDGELYYGVDLGSSRYITKIKAIYVGNSSCPDPSGYHIHYSIDGNEWSTVETAGIRNDDERSDTVSLDTPVVARFIRVDITKTMGKYSPKLAELETYGYIGVNMDFNTVGAQIRSNGSGYDLRFIAGMSPEYVDDNIKSIEAIGVLMAKKSDLGNDSLSLSYAKDNYFVKKLDIYYISTYYVSTLNKYTVTATITDIDGDSVNTEYTARMYIINKDGSVVYTDMITRSVAQGL